MVTQGGRKASRAEPPTTPTQAMEKFEIRVVEMLSRTVEVEAADYDKALQMVRSQYYNSEIILTEDDFDSVDIY